MNAWNITITKALLEDAIVLFQIETTKKYNVDKIRETHQKAYEKWSVEENENLEKMFCEGKSVKDLSDFFGRNVGAINSRIKKLELKEKYGS